MHYNRKPILFLDFIPVSHSPSFAKCMVFPKALRHGHDSKLLSFDEHILHSYLTAQDYQKKNLLIENLSGEEITYAIQVGSSFFLRGERLESEALRLNKLAIECLLNNDKDNHLHHTIHPDFHYSEAWLSSVMSNAAQSP